MSKHDDFIIEAYKQMVETLRDLNTNLSEIIIEQNKIIVQLQTTQDAPNNKKGAGNGSN